MNHKNNNRIVLLDVLRGLLILWVLVDHFLYDFGIMYYGQIVSSSNISLCHFARSYWASTYRSIAHPIVLILFFLLSGVSARFSRKPLSRAVKLLVLTLLLFTATFIFDKITGIGCTITFGVLYVFTVCAFISLLLDKIKLNKIVTLCIGLIVIAIGVLYEKGVFKFLSRELYFLVHDEIGYSRSADYFPLLPYLGYYLVGLVLGKIVYKEVKPKINVPQKVQTVLRPISFIGRTSLWWYFISQGVYIALIEGLLLIGVL